MTRDEIVYSNTTVWKKQRRVDCRKIASLNTMAGTKQKRDDYR